MKQKRALVTGGTGFLGPHLIRALLEKDWPVLAVDDLRTGTRDHVECFLGEPAFEFREGDITNTEFIERTVSEFAPQTIFHLAALHFIPYCVAHPDETINVNLLGTQRLLDASARASVECFILASTGDVYRESLTPHRESDPLGTTNIYGLSKLWCEELLRLARSVGSPTRYLAARLFNIFGPGETNPHVLPAILEGLRQGDVLRLGNLSPRRDYIYVTDVADALVRMSAYEGLETVFNVGAGRGASVSELLELLGRLQGKKIGVEIDPAKVRKVERQSLVADISLTRRELGWAPAVSLEEGLHRTLAAETPAVAAAHGH